MPELGTYGSVRGAPRDGRPYRDCTVPCAFDQSGAACHDRDIMVGAYLNEAPRQEHDEAGRRKRA